MPEVSCHCHVTLVPCVSLISETAPYHMTAFFLSVLSVIPHTHTHTPVTGSHKTIICNFNAFLEANGDCSTRQRLRDSSGELFFPFPTFDIAVLIMAHQICCHLAY